MDAGRSRTRQADGLFGDGGKVIFSAGGTQLNIVSLDPAYGGDDTLDGGAGNDILIGGSGNDLLYGSLSEDLLFGGNAAVVLVNGIVSSIASDLNDLVTESLFRSFNALAGNGEQTLAGLLQGLPGYLTLAAGSPGAPLPPEPLLDISVFQQVFKLGGASLTHLLEVTVFREAFGSGVLTLPAVPSHSVILEPSDGDQSAGLPPALPSNGQPPSQPVARTYARRPVGESDKRRGDAFVAMLGIAGLHAAHSLQGRGRGPLEGDAMTGTTGRVPPRSRKALDSIAPA
jgi:hypothetical protein